MEFPSVKSETFINFEQMLIQLAQNVPIASVSNQTTQFQPCH